jgi:hypothetical protein
MGDAHHHYWLNDHDSCSLYRTLARERGIRQSTAAEDNLELWLQDVCPAPPNPLIPKLVLFYQACHDGGGDRLIIIIATSEMQDAAWRYKQHDLINLTFGFCLAYADLLIGMALDDNKKGIPIGLIVFMAQPSAKGCSCWLQHWADLFPLEEVASRLGN